MASLSRSLTVPTSLARVAAYLSDLTTSTEWDPHTVRCRRLGDGPLGIGARYAHTREFRGYEATVDVEVVEYQAMAHIAWRGGNQFATGREDLHFAADADGGTVVTHSVDIALSGVARFGELMLPTVMRRIADDGTETLRDVLTRLPAQPAGR